MIMLVLDSSRDHLTFLIKKLLGGKRSSRKQESSTTSESTCWVFLGAQEDLVCLTVKLILPRNHPLGSAGDVWLMPMMLLSLTSFVYFFFFWPSIIHDHLQLDHLCSLELSFSDCWTNQNHSQKSKRYSQNIPEYSQIFPLRIFCTLYICLYT